jgi:2-oxoisovalerate dehydrogenase E2 component (dihydrolipoyl transacylase)
MGRYFFKLPDVGEGVTEAEIVEWHVQPGDTVAEDQPLVDVLTDKATVEITSPVAGKVLSLDGAAGEPAAVGAVIAVLEVEAGPEAAVAGGPTAEEPPIASPAPAPTKTAAAAPAHRPKAAPAVRRRAAELGVPLESIAGTGEDGRVTHRDLDTHLVGRTGRPAAAPPSDDVQEVKIAGLRRRIAENVAEAKRRIPHFSYVEEVDVTELEALRARMNADAGPGALRLTPLPFFARALVRAVIDFPQMNALYDDEAGVIRRHAAIHLGIAVQTEAGLMAPVVRHAEALDLADLAREIARLAQAARAGKAKREELSGSTITLTSLGALGGVATTPVINRPEVAIVSPNRIVARPVVIAGRIEVRQVMNLSSSFDHRVIDGYEAAAFIQRAKALLEVPALLFVDR